jgi:hypothetical protein
MNHLMKSFTGASQLVAFATPTNPVAPTQQFPPTNLYNHSNTPNTDPTTMTPGHHNNIIPRYAPPPTPMETLHQEHLLNSMLQQHLRRNADNRINSLNVNDNSNSEVNENNKDADEE